MLIRSTWTLCPTTDITLPRSYRLELVKELHRRMNLPMGEEAIASVSYSGIVGQTTYAPEFITFHADTIYSLSLCGLQESSSKAIAALALADSLEFLGATFQVIDRVDDVTSYEALYTNLVANEPAPVRQFQLRFVTPTAFAQNGIRLPLPVPALMFYSWLERWNHFAPVYLGREELVEYLSSSISLSSHRIQTLSLPIHQSKITGFVGQVTLRTVQSAEPLLANVANLLVEYAQFSGTGIKTRLGMGKTEYLQD